MKVVVISSGTSNDDPWYKAVRQCVLAEIMKQGIQTGPLSGVDLSFHRWVVDLPNDKGNPDRAFVVAVGHELPQTEMEKRLIFLLEVSIRGMDRIMMRVIF